MNNIRLSFTKVDLICFSHAYLVIMSYAYVWNKWLADVIMPSSRGNQYIDIVMCSGLGIIILFLWFIVVGIISGMFITFDKAEEWVKD